jgi:D-cysteine desulfhydrase
MGRVHLDAEHTTGMTTETRVTLGTWPTPVEPAPRLAAALGLSPSDL